jgi:hypothetical protein
VLLEPTIVVVANGFVEKALILGDGGRTQALGDVEVTTGEIPVELGECVPSRGRIEIFVL